MKHFLAWLKRYALMIAVFLFLGGGTGYYFYWHWRPFTQNAFLFANTTPVTPLVEGYLIGVHVKNNQFVKKGAKLITTYREPSRLTVVQLENAIAAKRAAIRSTDARILAADSLIRQRKAEDANNRYLYERATGMYAAASVSQAYLEERLRASESSAAAVTHAKHTAEALRHDRMAEEAEVRELAARLADARIRYEQTVVYALSDGYVTNMSLTPGGYYRPGDVLFGFVSTDVWWAQANLKESELSELRPGQRAKIWLWQYPGKTFHGVVEDAHWNVERRKSSRESGLPLVEKENEWFLLPQRFPVQIRILDPDPAIPFHCGGSCYVELETWARPVRQFFWQLFLWR